MEITWIVLTAILVALFFTGCVTPKPPVEFDAFTRSECLDSVEILFNRYILSNNVWGKGTITTYNQCVYAIKNLDSEQQYETFRR